MGPVWSFCFFSEMRCVQQLPACGRITLMFWCVFADKAAVKLPHRWLPPSTHHLPHPPQQRPRRRKPPLKVSAVTRRFWSDHPPETENKNKEGRASKYSAAFRGARDAALCLPNTFKASICGEQRELSAEREISNKVGMEVKKKKDWQLHRELQAALYGPLTLL